MDQCHYIVRNMFSYSIEDALIEMVRIYGTFILSDIQTEKGREKSLLYLIIREVVENSIKHFILFY